MPGQLNLPVIQGAPPGAPVSRSDCVDGPRPCKWVSCRYHLHAVEERAGRRWYDGHRPHTTVVAHTRVTCALDVIDALEEGEGLDREEVGKLLGWTPERVRQVEEQALGRVRLGLGWLEHRDGVCGAGCPWCEDVG